MKDECLLCGAPLVYLETDEIMECAACHNGVMPERDVKGSGRDCKKAYGSTVLPYARTVASMQRHWPLNLLARLI